MGILGQPCGIRIAGRLQFRRIGARTAPITLGEACGGSRVVIFIENGRLARAEIDARREEDVSSRACAGLTIRAEVPWGPSQPAGATLARWRKPFAPPFPLR